MPIKNKLGSGVITTTTPASNPCSPNPCQNNGFCTQTGTSNYFCSCLAGFQGSNCQIFITTTTTTPTTTREPSFLDESPVNCPFFASQGFCQDFYFINGTWIFYYNDPFKLILGFYWGNDTSDCTLNFNKSPILVIFGYFKVILKIYHIFTVNQS